MQQKQIANGQKILTKQPKIASIIAIFVVLMIGNEEKIQLASNC